MMSQIGVASVDGNDTLVLATDGGPIPLASVLGGARVPADTIELIERWDEIGPLIAAGADTTGESPLSASSMQWRPPVIPRKLLCVGANYHDHVAEMTKDGPAPAKVPFPFSFLKPSSSLVGSGQNVPVPSYGTKLDWELELAVVIGAGAKRGGDPRDAIFGFSILNDLSLRDFFPFPHILGLDAVISKGFDGAAPMGPWITTVEDLDLDEDRSLELRVNGELRQDSNTNQMIYSALDLVEYYLRVLTLEPGDVIATGTPAGVGAGRKPPQYLQPGDEVEAHITGLGSLTTSIAQPIGTSSLDMTRAGG
jgi:2-keto-4-pentenoate hydratase/2-oxohepta-3-ene-1,7-dioic acid hydratase in catechol pathway